MAGEFVMPVRTRTALRAAALCAPWLLPWRTAPQDLALYNDWARRMGDGALPYRDFPLEYPPLAAVLIWAPRLLCTAVAAFVLLMASFDALQRAALWRRGGAHADAGLVLGTAAGVTLYYTHLKRFDPAAALCATWGLCTLVRRPRSLLAWVWLGLGASLKVYPVVLAPVALVYSRAQGASVRRLMAQTSVACALGAAILGAAWALTGPASWQWLTYQSARGLHIACVMSAIGIVWRGVGQPFESVAAFGTLQADAAWAASWAGRSACITLGLLGITWAVSARKAQSVAGLWRMGAASVMALLLAAKVFSPQYMVWLVPLMVMGSTARRRFDRVLAGLLILMCVCTAMTFPGEGRIAAGDVQRQAALVVRSAALLTAWLYVLCTPADSAA